MYNVHVIMSMMLFLHIRIERKRNESKIQSMVHAKVNLENSIPTAQSAFQCFAVCITTANSTEQNSTSTLPRCTTYINGSFSMDAKKLMKNGWRCMTNSVERTKQREKTELNCTRIKK